MNAKQPELLHKLEVVHGSLNFLNGGVGFALVVRLHIPLLKADKVEVGPSESCVGGRTVEHAVRQNSP